MYCHFNVPENLFFFEAMFCQIPSPPPLINFWPITGKISFIIRKFSFFPSQTASFRELTWASQKTGTESAADYTIDKIFLSSTSSQSLLN